MNNWASDSFGFGAANKGEGGNMTAVDILTAGVGGGAYDLLKSIFPDAQPNEVDEQTSALLQEQYQDWESSFKPIELQALSQISTNNAAVLPDALQEARDTVTDSYRSMEGIADRQNRGLGITQTPQQSKTSKRLLDLNKSLSAAGAENTTRSNVRQMDEQLLMGAAPNPNVQK
jgi:hypothetical protein